MLASSARNVKLFALKEKNIDKQVTATKMLEKGKGLMIPKPKTISSSKQGKHLATYKSCKEDKLHSISMAHDRENFITADEARVDLWNIEKTNDTVYSLVDYERRHSTFEDERITSAKFNQNSGCSFLYTTSTGKINICDLRERSDFHSRPSLQLEVGFKNNGLRSHVFNKWVDCVSEAKFVPGTTQVVSRDYMSVKLWDLRSASSYNSKPLYSAQVTDYMERHLP